MWTVYSNLDRLNRIERNQQALGEDISSMVKCSETQRTINLWAIFKKKEKLVSVYNK